MSTETAPAVELAISDDAHRAYIDAYTKASRDGHGGTAYTFGLAAAAPLIVAAELRRLTTLRTFRDVQDALQARANELDPC